MCLRYVQGLIVLLSVFFLASSSSAQRGAGEQTGVARRSVRPPITKLTGTVERIVTEACRNTTGRSGVGTHFVIRSASDGKALNVHMGPARLVQDDAQKLEVGTTVAVRAFRTEAMAQGHYNAVTIDLGDQVVRLRGEDLRPRWAGRRPAAGGQRDGARRRPRWRSFDDGGTDAPRTGEGGRAGWPR